MEKQKRRKNQDVNSDIRKWILFFAICIMVFVYSVILYLPSPLITVIADETHWSLGQVGNFMGIFNLFTGICTFFTTPLVDRFGTKGTAAIALALAVLSGIVAVIGGLNYYVQCLGRIISGAGFGIMFPVPGIIISEIFSADKSARMLGIRTTIDFIGCSSAYYITIPIFHLLHSWQYTFAVWGFISVIPLLMLAAVAGPRKGRAAYGIQNDQTDAKRLQTEKRDGKLKRSSWGIALRQKWMWFMAIGLLGVNMPFYGFSTYLPAYLQFDKGMSPSLSSAVTSVLAIAGVFAGVASGMITEITGRRKVLGCGALIMVLIGAIMILYTPYIPLISVGAFMVGFSVGAYIVYYSTVPADILKGRYPGVYAAAISLTLGLGTAFTVLIPVIFQFILDLGMSIRTGLFVFLLPTVVSFILVCMVKETGPKGKYARAGIEPYTLQLYE